MEPNVILTGDEARILMVALATAAAQVPCGTAIQLYHKLAQISFVQPPTQTRQENSL